MGKFWINDNIHVCIYIKLVKLRQKSLSHSQILVGQLSKSTAELVTVGESDKSLNK